MSWHDHEDESKAMPRKEFDCDQSVTHYQGCQCHEARHAAEIAKLRKIRECSVELCEGGVFNCEKDLLLEGSAEWEERAKKAEAQLARSEEARKALREALQGVLAVADRKTKEFDAARAALVSSQRYQDDLTNRDKLLAAEQKGTP